MAKLETHLTGPFDTVLDQLHQAILDGSLSASYEDGSDCTLGNARVAVRIYERYSMFGGNRVSMSLTLAGEGDIVFRLGGVGGVVYAQPAVDADLI